MNQIDHELKTIEHIPNDKRLPKWIWKAGFALIALLWAAQWYIDGFDWDQLMLGLGTGIVLMGWVMERTGGEIPASWRSKSPRQ